MINEAILRSEEIISLKLRKLYSQFGYSCFKMSKFEEYDLYSNNKNFLLSDSVIAFTDTNGKMMALKPDVTLSIAKNTKLSDTINRLYYDENVYRVSESVGRYKEINQVGLECLGDLDDYNYFEVLSLAGLSLKQISNDAVLTVSNLGIISSVLERVSGDKQELLVAISQKNEQGVLEFCLNNNVGESDTKILALLATPSMKNQEKLVTIKQITQDKKITDAICELENFTTLCQKETSVSVVIDLSLVSDLNFYNGLVFNGFIKGIPTRVLSGGSYDKLMEKLGKKSNAIGFAVYLDLLERFDETEKLDVDIVLLYDDSVSVKQVYEKVISLSGGGKKVVALKDIPKDLTYEQVVYFKDKD